MDTLTIENHPLGTLHITTYEDKVVINNPENGLLITVPLTQDALEALNLAMDTPVHPLYDTVN